MRKILIFGAGRSSTFLIEYLSDVGLSENWLINVADSQIEQAKVKFEHLTNVNFSQGNIDDDVWRHQLIKESDIVVSFLPHFLHQKVALDCLQFSKDFVTASYQSKELFELNDAVVKKNLVFMSELGLDPGIDHMSALKLIKEIKQSGGEIESFISATGGLVADVSDDNPLHYKISWNSRNIILAGQGISQYLENNEIVYSPYLRLFENATSIAIPNESKYVMYANRDSLKYQQIYGLEKAKTLIRGTLRHKSFCEFWDIILKLGLTDDLTEMNFDEKVTLNKYLRRFLIFSSHDLRQDIASTVNKEINAEVWAIFKFLGFVSDETLPKKQGTPAEILESIMVKKISIGLHDRDLVLMVHEVKYRINGVQKKITSCLRLEGESQTHTAMAKTVGLPCAIFVKHRLLNNITLSGCKIPSDSEIYEPILDELALHQIIFDEVEQDEK